MAHAQMAAGFEVVLSFPLGMEGVSIVEEGSKIPLMSPTSLSHVWVTMDGFASISTNLTPSFHTDSQILDLAHAQLFTN